MTGFNLAHRLSQQQETLSQVFREIGRAADVAFYLLVSTLGIGIASLEQCRDNPKPDRPVLLKDREPGSILYRCRTGQRHCH